MRMHVALNVRNLEASLSFYTKLFHAEPAKVKENYAKFELDEPPLHFSLNVRPYADQGVLNHLGFQVSRKEDVLAAKERLECAGLFSVDEMDTTCCYAVQDKIWVTDPEGNAWEVFYTKADAEFESADARSLPSPSVCCTPIPQEKEPAAEAAASSGCCAESLRAPQEAAAPSVGGGCGCSR